MPPYGEPDWTTPGDTTNTTSVSAGVPIPLTSSGISSGGGQNSNTADERNKARCVVLGLSVLNLGFAAMMGALGILSLITYKPTSLNTLTQSFLCVYMIIFGALLFCYEFIWWQPVAALNVVFRKNFGFLYGLLGKGFYLIFSAFLTLGLFKEDSSRVHGLAVSTGIAWLAGGVLHIFVACSMPQVNAIYKPPSVGLSQMGSATETPNPV